MSASLSLATPRQAPRPPGRLGAARLLDIVIVLLALSAIAWLAVRANQVLGYRWNWSIIPTYLFHVDPATGAWQPNLLLLGLLTTLRLAIWSLLLGTVLGVGVASCRISTRPVLRWLGRIFVELVRNTPPIVLIFVLDFFVASQILPPLGLDETLGAAPAWLRDLTGTLFGAPERINDFLAGLICLGLIASAYVAEIVRAGLQSVPRSQVEAGRALGLSGWAVFRKVVLPPAIRNVLPALAGQFIVSIKDSSLVSLISVQELTFMTSEVSSTTQRFFEVWLFTAAVYFTICYCCSLMFQFVERRWRRAR